MSKQITRRDFCNGIRELFKAGRHVVYSTSFATYEKQVRDQLQALLGPHGFNHEADIKEGYYGKPLAPRLCL